MMSSSDPAGCQHKPEGVRPVVLQEAQSRNALDGGAAEAGNRAVAELSLHLVDMEADETVIDPRALTALVPSPRLVAGQS